MAATTELTSGAGLRRVQYYTLSTSGVISASPSGTTGYSGTKLRGVSSASLTLPSVQRIQHVGDDRLLAQDYLPPNEGMSGEIMAVIQNLTADGELTDTLVQEIGEVQLGGLATNKQGDEIDVFVVIYRQALNMEAGTQNSRRWQQHIIPICRLVPRGGTGATQGGGEEQAYDLIPDVASTTPWGVAFSEANNGFTEAQYLRAHSDYPWVFEEFQTYSGSDSYTLNWTPISTDKFTAIDPTDGSSISVASVSTANSTVTLTSATDGSMIVAYETSDDIS